MSTFAVMAGIAAVLAIVASALFIGACLLISWTTDTIRGPSPRQQEMERTRMPPVAANGRHRHGPGMPVTSRHGSR
ncbi:MAG: hypothetical protein ACRDNW_00220 [Trebonia sp.]